MKGVDDPILQITALTVRHGAASILDTIDLTIQPNEMFVLLGASGSGKTTLLRAIAGFAQPAAGRIVLNGADMAGLAPHRRPVNTVFQNYALFPHMTVAANIGFGLRHLDRATAAARVAEMLALVRLESLADRKPHQLSGGQQQRVALARGLAPNPALLLLDEPLSALDRALRAETRDELVRLRRQLGTSFILVTHDQEEALTMADRIGIMRAGRMEQVGTPAAVYERPASRFAASFLGAANILPCTVRPDGVTLDVTGQTHPVRAARPAPPGPALLALRPERLRFGGGGNRLDGTLSQSAYAGDAMSYVIRLPDGTGITLRQPLGDGLPADRPPDGAAVTLSFAPEACILLPP